MDFEHNPAVHKISSLYSTTGDQNFGKLYAFRTRIYTETPINKDWIQRYHKLSRHINSATDPRNRIKRKAHYHRRRVQPGLRYYKPSLNVNLKIKSTIDFDPNNSTTAIEVLRPKIMDAPWNKSIQKESIKRHIMNICRYLYSNNTNITSKTKHMKTNTSVHSTHGGIIVEDVSNHTTSSHNIHTSTTGTTGNVSTVHKEESSTEIKRTSHETVTDATFTTNSNHSTHVDNKTESLPEATTKGIWSHLISHKAQYDIKRTYYMPTLVVADKSFMEYHINTDYDAYIMTVMNTAAECLHDLSLGVNVELSVVRIIYIEESNILFHSEGSMDCLLSKFCNWTHSINRKDIQHPLHHDVAVLITRRGGKRGEKQCDSCGSAYVGGACVAHKSCIVVQDTGLLMGVNIAHQLGHLLGAVNDHESKGRYPGINATTQFNHVMAPTPRYGTLVWSPRSKESIVRFFRNGYGVCLEDEPPKSMLEFTGMLPGVMYNASYQCHLITRGSKACLINPIEPCMKLFCHCNENDRHCTYSGERPAQGTPCGSDKWCYNGACIQAGERPGSEEGGWGAWQRWEECSRTCGGGVQRSRRHCDSPVPAAGGRYCVGDSDRYRTCNTHFCNPDEKSFRAVQCAEFDHVIIAEQYQSWKPLPLQATDACGLYCKSPTGLKMRLHPRMRNGTPCRKGTNNLCINGICTRVGCDWVIGSNVVKDRCGLCGGDGSHCHKVDGWFNQTTSVNSNIEFVVEIPKDSRQIIVYETCNSCNMLAVSNTTSGNQTEEFYLIGNKTNGTRGTFPIKSIYGIYLHVQPGADLISIQGPLPVNIRVYVLMRGKLSPIYYSYMNTHLVEHTEHATTEAPERLQRNIFKHWHPTRYQWEFLEWSDCSARCEVGTSVSTPHCVSVWFGRVSDSYCDITNKPRMKIRVCNERPCALRWQIGPWGPCHNSIQWRTVLCLREARSYLSPPIITDGIHCDISKPATIRNCQSDRDCRNENENHNRKINDHLNIPQDKHSTNEEFTEPSIKNDFNSNFLNFYIDNLSSISNNTSKLRKNTKENINLYQTTTSILYSPNFSLDNDKTTHLESSENFMEILSKQALLDDDFRPNVNISKILNSNNIFTSSYDTNTNDSYDFLIPRSTTIKVPQMSVTPLPYKSYNTYLNYMPTTPYDFTTLISETITKNKRRKINQGNNKKKLKIPKLKKKFKLSKRKREILKKSLDANYNNDITKPAIDKSEHAEDHTFLVIKLAKSNLGKLNSIFNNSNKINIIIDSVNTENPVNVVKACEVDNATYKLNKSSFDSSVLNLNENLSNKFTKNNTGIERINYKNISYLEDSLNLQVTNTLMKPHLRHKSKRTYSNGFVTKIPLKIFTGPETLDEFKRKQISNDIKQVKGLEDVTSHRYTNVRRNCFRNIVNDTEGQSIINIYCNSCYIHLKSPKNISVTKKNFIKNKSTEKYYNNEFLKNKTKRYKFTVSNELLGNYLETHSLENESSEHIPNGATLQFVDITLVPKHGKRNRSFRTKIQKFRDNFKKKKILNNETFSGNATFLE